MASAAQVHRDGSRLAVTREWVPEEPVALEFNGLAYAVMMATPADLEDFATGFALTEGLAAHAREVSDLAIAEVEQGWIVRAALSGLGAEQLGERVRSRVAESRCGLCGIENLEAVARPLPPVAAHGPIAPDAIFAALAAMQHLQPLGLATGAAHATAPDFCAGVTAAGALAAVPAEAGSTDFGAHRRSSRKEGPGLSTFV